VIGISDLWIFQMRRDFSKLEAEMNTSLSLFAAHIWVTLFEWPSKEAIFVNSSFGLIR